MKLVLIIFLTFPIFQMLERRLNFHTGGGNYTALYGTVEPQTDSDQESYV